MRDDGTSQGFFSGLKVKLAGGIVSLAVGLCIAFFHPWVERKGENFANKTVVPAGVVAPAGVQLAGQDAESPFTVVAAAKPVAPKEVEVLEGKPVKMRNPRRIQNAPTVPEFESTPEVEYVQSSGTGAARDRETAVSKALEEAISKQGSQISAELKAKLVAETKRFNASKTKTVGQSIVSDFSRVTDGLVRWWDILNEEDDGQNYSVEVVAIIAKMRNTASEHPTRKTIVVLPFGVQGNAFFKGQSTSAPEVGRRLRESTVTYLVNSRKFAVLDKTFTDELDALTKERPNRDPIQAAIAAGKTLGAEYGVVGLAHGLSVQEQKVGSLNVPEAEGAVEMRVIRIDTRQTVLASAFKLAELPNLDLTGSSPEVAIYDALGRIIANRILNTIYPVKVAALNGPSEVILNRGGDDFVVGQRFELCNPGEEIKDPTTGESLGMAERKVGIVEVIRVLPKVCYAKVISKTEDIVVEAICHKAPLAPKEDTKEKITVRNEIDNLFK